MNAKERAHRLHAHPVRMEQSAAIKALRRAAEQYAIALEKYCHNKRETALACTQLEESLMWAVASVTRPGDGW